MLQDHVLRKWDIPGEIIKVRLAPDNKFLSYEIRTDKGHLTTRHRSMIKATPKVNNEANIPAIVDAPDDDSTTPEPAKTWSRGDRLRATTATIHEADDLILKTSSPDRPSSAEDFPSWISISSMKAFSNSSNQTATAAIIPSWPGGESSDGKTTDIAT